MEPPHPYWAHHDHSDEHLNLLFTPYPQESVPQPPHPYWAHHDHNHDRSHEHLNIVYPTVRELRSLYPPSPDDSGYFSPSETQWRAKRWKLRVVNTTPPPPPSPPPSASPPKPVRTTTSVLFAKEDGDEDDESRNFLARDMSSGWSASSSSADSVSTIIRVKNDEKNQKKKEKRRPGKYSSAKSSDNNICSRALRRAAHKCIGKKVLAAKREMMKKISRSAAGSSAPTSRSGFGIGNEIGTGIGNSEIDGATEEKQDPSAGSRKRVCEPWVRVGVLERIKRTLLLRKKGPVVLKRAEVRFPLD